MLNVRISKEMPVFDSTAAYRITNYPMEKRGFRPLAEVRFYMQSGKAFFIKLVAFEAKPSPSSRLAAAVCFYPDESENYIAISIGPDSKAQCEIRGGGRVQQAEELFMVPSVTHFTGEDIQGLFWGVVIEIPMELINKIYGRHDFAAGHIIAANAYKYDTSIRSEHYGSLFDNDFKCGGISRRDFDKLELTNY